MTHLLGEVWTGCSQFICTKFVAQKKTNSCGGDVWNNSSLPRNVTSFAEEQVTVSEVWTSELWATMCKHTLRTVRGVNTKRYIEGKPVESTEAQAQKQSQRDKEPEGQRTREPKNQRAKEPESQIGREPENC